MLSFSSLNPYESLGYVIADTPAELISEIAKIKTPIKIHFIVPFGTRQVAYYTGDFNAKAKSDGITANTKRPRVSKVR